MMVATGNKVVLTKVRTRTAYNVPTYENGGLTYTTGAKAKDGDAYMVTSKDGTVLGLLYKWDGVSSCPEPWSAQKVLPALTNAPGFYAFASSLRTGKTRAEALGKLLDAML